MLQISGVSVRYPNGVEALRGIDLTVGTGLFGLLGPNGAGKSTLMRTLATLQTPDSGDVSMHGTSIFADATAHRRRLGYLPQDFGVYPGLSAIDVTDKDIAFCKIEELLALWTDLAEPVRTRAARMAPRVLGHVGALPRPADRHPRRRQ